MSARTTAPRSSVESWSATAFLVAGVLALGYGALKGLKAYGGLEVITAYDVLYGGFVLLTPVIALVTLYPTLRESSPRLSRGAVGLALLSGIATVAIMLQVIVMTLSMEGYPAIPGDGPAWPVVALFVGFIALALGFLLSAVAARGTEQVPAAVSGLLAVPFLMWFGLIAANVMLPSGDYLGLYAYAPIGVALLGVGYRLRTARSTVDRAEPEPDSPA